MGPLLLSMLVGAAPLIQDRAPLAWHAVGEPPEALRPMAAAALESRTRLQLVNVGDLGPSAETLDPCSAGTNLGCWVYAMRRTRTPYLLIVTAHPGRLTLLLLDLERAARALDEGDDESLESRLFRDAVYNEVASVDLADPQAIQAAFGQFFDTKVRTLFERARHWRENGTLEIDSEREGLAIAIDEEQAGITRSGRTRLSGVSAGARRVQLIDPDARLFHAPVQVDVRRGEVTLLTPTLSPVETVGATARRVTLWSGVALSVLGAGLLVYALAAPGDGHDVLPCPGGSCPDFDRRYATFDGSPDGVPIAPVAATLIATGAGASLGTLLGDPQDLPWIAWLIGAVAGGTALTLSLTLN